MARSYTSFIFVFGALLLAGCGNDEDGGNRSSAALFDQDIAIRDSILTQLAAISSDPFAHAFNALPSYNYTRYIRTEQFNDDAYLIAFRERTVQHEGPVGQRRFTMVASDSSGSYDFGFFRQFVSTNVEDQDPDDLTPYLFPEDPAYLTPENYESYVYRYRPDTLMLDKTANVIEVRARPVEGDGKNIRRAYYFFEQDTNKLIAFQLERIDLALFFREESLFFVHLQQTPDGAQVPYNTRFETRIIMPFKPPQWFRTVSTYSNLEAGSTSMDRS